MYIYINNYIWNHKPNNVYIYIHMYYFNGIYMNLPIRFHPNQTMATSLMGNLRTGPRGGRRIATGATRRGRPPRRDGWRKSLANDKCIHGCFQK